MPHLVLVGGGHAMLPVLVHAGEWVARGVQVTLIDAHRSLYYSGMVPEYLGGVYTQEQVRIDLADLCRQSGVDFLHAAARSLDVEAQSVRLEDGPTVSYDVLAVDVGGVNPHRPAGGIPTKPIYHIETLEHRIREVLATASASFPLCIVGGGAAGVEIALNVSGRFHSAGRIGDLDLTILEAGSSLLPGFPDGLQSYVAHRLSERGISIRLRTPVTAVEDGVLRTSDTSLSADPVLWATGSVGADLLRDSGLPTDERGFLRVGSTLRSPADPRVFAGGDCATINGHEDLAKVGVHAVKHGPVLRQNLDQTLRALEDRSTDAPLPPAEDLTAFRPYPAAPLILSTGVPEGLWTSGPLWFRRRSLLRLKHWIDRRWIRTYNSTWKHRPLHAYLDAGASTHSCFST